MNLTIEQRAEREVKRRNKKIAQDYPLLVEQLKETKEENLARLQRLGAQMERYFERIRLANIEMRKRGEKLREVVRSKITEEGVKKLDCRFEQIYKRKKLDDLGAEYADYWWDQVRTYDPGYAHEHCPNKGYHELPCWGRDGICLTCGMRLENVRETEPKTSQLSLIIKMPR